MRGSPNRKRRPPSEKPETAEEREPFEQWHERVLAWGCTRCRCFMESSLLCKGTVGELLDVTVEDAVCPKKTGNH